MNEWWFMGWRRKYNRGFTIIELMISMLIVSALGLGIATYMKTNQSTMRESDLTELNRQKTQMVQLLMSQDLQHVVALRPACTDDSPPNPSFTVSTACSSVPVRSGITPLPGLTKTDVDSLAVMTVPSNWDDDVANLTGESDAVRVLVYDFEDSFSCPLDQSLDENPSQTAGAAVGAETLWVDWSCNGLLEIGRLYIITQTFDSNTSTNDDSDLVSYSNLFQITDLVPTTDVRVEISARSASNRFNQVGGLGRSGFGNTARIYPVKLVEYAFEPEGGTGDRGLYRREIRPTSTDTLGYGDWRLVMPDADGLTFNWLTTTDSAVTEYERTLSGMSGVEDDDGVEDIVSVLPRFVLRSSIARNDGVTYDNPLTSVTESDHYPRTDVRFMVEMRNR